MNMSGDASRVMRVLRIIERDLKKDGAVELTRFVKDVGYRAMSVTSFANPAKIERDLKKDKRLIGAAVNALRAAGRKITQESIKSTAEKILKSRKSGSKFRRAGWIPGILKLGGTIRGATGGVLKPGGSASEGYAKKATAAQLLSLIGNATFGEMEGSNEGKARAEMEGALKKAVRFVTRDRIKYIRRKFEKMLQQRSD